ncbi:MAG TPA: hypothetical protein VJ731_13025 [Terriglobales bacterium]|nr:hypothetical protein [Terriglobales bacterium]
MVAVPRWNLEGALVSGYHQHLARAVVNRRAAMAASQVFLDFFFISGAMSPSR